MNSTFRHLYSLASMTVLALILFSLGSLANAAPPLAQPVTVNLGPPYDPDCPTDAPTTQPVTDTEIRLRALEDANQRLQQQIEQLKEDHADTSKKVGDLLHLSGKIGGYLDFGIFYVEGDGSGIRYDLGNTHFPEYKSVIPGGSWVFMGDPLSTAINSRGEPPTTSSSRAVTFDAIKNGGKASFIVNALNVAIFAGIGQDATLNASVDFVPRGRNVSNPNELFLGDFIDVKLAYLEYIVPVKSRAFQLSIFAGKFDSVLGIEYRSQESPDRIGVTPSLICRYTCGRPLGVKLRARFWESLVLNIAATNGSSFTEMFPFGNEIDFNNYKTLSGRLSILIPIGGEGLDFGVSGAYGAQDFQTSDKLAQWHVGGDMHLLVGDVDLSAEYVRGRANGKTDPGAARCNAVACLDYQGAYALFGYRITNWLMPYVRGDWREAHHRFGADFIYISQVLRGTGGLRFELGTNVIIKAEYTVNRELGRIPQFRDNVFTSSLVVKY